MRVKPVLSLALFAALSGSFLIAQQPDGAPPPGQHRGMGGMRPGFRIGPPGIWWHNPDLIQKLTLTPDQQKKMDDIFQASRLRLVDLKANLEKQNLTLEPMLSANPPDTTKTLAQIAAEPYITQPLVPLLEKHRASIEIVRKRATQDRGVVFFDLTEDQVENLNKFIAYDMFPTAAYTVNVSSSGSRAKVSIGSNPWARPAQAHNLSKIAEKYGGGGHPVVAAISFKPDEVEKAKRVAKEIVETLQGPVPAAS